MLARSCLGLTLALSLFVSAAGSHAGAVVSTFDSGDEGWVPHLNAGGVVTYLADDGNPPGAIVVDDISNDWAYLAAPAKFLGPALYGGTLSFDLKHLNDSPTQYPTVYKVRVALVGNGLYLINELELPTESWANYSTLLSESAGWRIFDNLSQNYHNAAPAPTAAQIQGVLANLSGLYIATDYTDGNALTNSIDRTYLDNVRLSVVPEPSSAILIALGTLGLFARRRSRG